MNFEIGAELNMLVGDDANISSGKDLNINVTDNGRLTVGKDLDIPAQQQTQEYMQKVCLI